MKVVSHLGLEKDQTLHDKTGLFGADEATRMTETSHLIKWWNLFGLETPDMRKIATRILGLCCSASSCERNWSIFAHFHTKSRNGVGVLRLYDFIYCNYNSKLAERFKTNKLLVESGSKKYDVIYVEEFNDKSEWVTDDSRPCNEFVW